MRRKPGEFRARAGRTRRTAESVRSEFTIEQVF